MSNNKNTLFCFGDSWAAGAELDLSHEKTFSDLVAQQLGYNHRNLGVQGLSLGLILRDISIYSSQIKKQDIVLVVVPPDSRWYTEWETIFYDKDINFYLDKTESWFEYHHQLFVFAICSLLEKIGCQFLLMHNYGRYPLNTSEYFFHNFYHEQFLSKDSLTSLLTNDLKKDKMKPIEVQTTLNNTRRGPNGIFFGTYFEGNRHHPNQKGHQRIADLIINFINTRYFK